MTETTQPAPDLVTVGDRRIAVRHRAGSAPGLFWLGGFRSDMAGTKAEALDRMAAETGAAMTRFDYSGHGASGGKFLDGTISRWLEEAVAVFEAKTEGEQVVVGSSMGGWLALLMNRALRKKGVDRVRALVLIAPAVDMTKDLMRANFSDAQLRALAQDGQVEIGSEYSEEPDILTRALIEDGARHRMFGNPIGTGCPVSILQGVKDADVPVGHAIKLMTHLLSDEATLSLIPEGEHRLSTPEDLERLRETVSRFL